MIKCTMVKWEGKNVLKVTVPAKWEHKLGMYNEGPYGHIVRTIPNSKKRHEPMVLRPTNKPVKTVKGVIQHPDLSFEIKKEDKTNEKLLTALNARQNGIVSAHHLYRSKQKCRLGDI